MMGTNGVRARFVRVLVIGMTGVLSCGAEFITQPGDWNAPIGVATGTSGVHHDMAVNRDTDTVHVVYSSGGNVYHQSVDSATGAVSAATQILAGGATPSIALDSAGNLHIAAYDSSNQNLVYGYATAGSGGASWTTTTLDSTAEDRGQGTRITVDPGNRIHIGYRGQNGTTDGTLGGKGSGSDPFYDLWYTRFDGDAAAGGTTTPANWDTPQVLVHSSRATDGRSIIQIGDGMSNLDIEADADNVWLFRREGQNSETQDGGYFFHRPVDAVAGSAFTQSTSSGFGAGASWAATLPGQFALRADGTPYRVAWDRAARWVVGSGDSGFVGVSYDAAGNPVDSDPGTAGFQGIAIDMGPHGDDWWRVGPRPDLVIDDNGMFHAIYYDGLSPTTGLKYAFSLDGESWSTEYISGGGAYTRDNRIAFDPVVGGGFGQIYLLSGTGGTVTLFSREAQFIPEPGAFAILLAATALHGLRRRRA